MKYVVVIVLAVLILIGLINKKKIAAAEKAAAEKAAAEKEAIKPFSSIEVKQYYEMAYGLLASSTKERSGDDIRRFVGFHTSRETDFSVSSAACKFLSEGIMRKVSLFKSNADLTTALTAKGISSDKIEQIIELNKKLDESFAYRYLPEDADTICNPDNYDCDFYKKTLVFKNSRDSIVPLTAEKAAALKAAAERAAAERAAAEKAAVEKAAAEKAAAEKAAAEKAAAERAAAEKAAAEKAAAEKAAAEKAAAERAAAEKAAEEKKILILQEIEKDCKEVFDNCSSYELGNLIEELYKCLKRKKSVYVNNLLRNTREAGFVDGLTAKFKAAKAEFEAEREAEMLFCEVLYDNYFDKLRCVLVDTFNKILSEKRDLHCKLYGADKYLMIAAKQAAAITLRALNYENHGQSKEKYSAITENTCREFISNYEMFKSEDENKVANAVLGEISGDLCGGGAWYLNYELKDHHIDAVCHAFWKSVVAKLQESDSADSNYIFNMFFDYFKPNQDKLDHLAVEYRQYMELEARKKAVRRQCDGCARCDYCQEKYKRENCSAWIPRS